MWSINAQIEKKISTLPSLVSGLKGFIQEVAAAPEATPDNFNTTFDALLRTTFKAFPTTPSSTHGTKIPWWKRKTTSWRKLNFSSDALASSLPTKKAKDKGKAPQSSIMPTRANHMHFSSEVVVDAPAPTTTPTKVKAQRKQGLRPLSSANNN
ncbi:hypothetical protein V6N13_001397 [Hibiscus sabdariffa]